MIVTVFRLRMNADLQRRRPTAPWRRTSARWPSRCRGFISAKCFTADGGERVTLVEFEDEHSHKAWATHPEQMAAKKEERESLLSKYRIQVCEVKKTMQKP
jgi:heme-degrading monooxygenase HmoA